MTTQKNNPLHGITLQALLTELVDTYGWDELAQRININCFKKDPSIKSSLKFLRKTPWAREKVEQFYLRHKGVRPQRKKPAPANRPQQSENLQAQIWGSGKKQD